MNKLVIPATICAFALVGAVLLLLPVEDAMAVHTTISTNINKQDRYIAFQLGANSTTLTNAIIIPAKTSQVLIVNINTAEVDGDTNGFGPTFEATDDSSDVPVGTLSTLGSGLGLQIKSMAADTEHFISIIVAEDAE